MMLALLSVILVMMIIMTLSSNGRVPWAGKLRRIHAGTAHKAEWMAPEEVVRKVRTDYMTALEWLRASAQGDWLRSQAQAADYLDGAYLKRCVLGLAHYASVKPRFVGVLRADHYVMVRQFSEDGESCLVIDQQTGRRMATYDRTSGERMLTQDLGDQTQVYTMVYDRKARRWKIAGYIQTLPQDWYQHRGESHIQMMATLPRAGGRDN